MKKLFLSFALLLVATSAGAYDVTTTEVEEPLHIKSKIDSQNRIDKAIKQRYRSYLRKMFQTTQDRTTSGQKARHELNKKRNHVGTTKETGVKREGELKTVPYLEQRRHNSGKSLTRTNAKQVFRARAIDYYLDGGYADTEMLRNKDLLYGSTHKVRQYGSAIEKKTTASADVRSQLIDMQRNIGTDTHVPTGYQKTVHRKGDATRYFYHPWMPKRYLEGTE